MKLSQAATHTQPEVIYAFAQLDCTEKPGLSLRGFVHATIKRAMFAVWNIPVDSESWAVGWCLTQPRDAIESEAAWVQCADSWLEMATTPGGVDPGSWRAWWMGSAVFPQLFNLAISHTIYGDSRVVIRGSATGNLSTHRGYPKPFSPASVLLTPMLTWALCRELPVESRRSWDRVYSSSRDGRSWSSFQSTIERRGAVLLLVQETTPIADAGETTEGASRIFGAYFDNDLERRPSWHGSPSNFVFSLSKESPLGLNIFRTTGFNNHYQYFNYATKTLPNGLGAGGQLGHFGLWIDSSFTRGCSNPAATFGSQQLSTETEFAVDVVEAWLVRPSERLDEVGGRKGSVLDTNPEAAAFLELANRPMYSKMLPDPVVNDSN
ncbi:TLD-domain-containing protein [Kickxella alabastrina]|uniref:TLD-domain-containing protein n=1 Tax=Kickxella alabastrina TaxID=61397 RepID=UPI00221FA624|nr:TLD-domain-containing protein [Kickxella alabastrina]KAI7820752.1 TLD-domain-containing protein [Kickxella alabastrina]